MLGATAIILQLFDNLSFELFTVPATRSIASAILIYHHN